MNQLLVMGSAPCLHEDLNGLDLGSFDVMAINRAALMYLDPIKWLVTYHPSDMVKEDWPGSRERLGGNNDFLIVLASLHRCAKKVYGEHRFAYTSPPSPSGSSTLLGVMHGLSLGYEKIVVAGAPLTASCACFQSGWRRQRKALAGKVRSVSGWTNWFLHTLDPEGCPNAKKM